MPRFRREGGNKRCFCPSIAYIANSEADSNCRNTCSEDHIIPEPNGLACPNLEGRFPALDATRIPVSRSKDQRSRSPGPLVLTHILRHIFYCEITAYRWLAYFLAINLHQIRTQYSIRGTATLQLSPIFENSFLNLEFCCRKKQLAYLSSPAM